MSPPPTQNPTNSTTDIQKLPNPWPKQTHKTSSNPGISQETWNEAKTDFLSKNEDLLDPKNCLEIYDEIKEIIGVITSHPEAARTKSYLDGLADGTSDVRYAVCLALGDFSAGRKMEREVWIHQCAVFVYVCGAIGKKQGRPLERIVFQNTMFTETIKWLIQNIMGHEVVESSSVMELMTKRSFVYAVQLTSDVLARNLLRVDRHPNLFVGNRIDSPYGGIACYLGREYLKAVYRTKDLTPPAELTEIVNQGAVMAGTHEMSCFDPEYPWDVIDDTIFRGTYAYVAKKYGEKDDGGEHREGSTGSEKGTTGEDKGKQSVKETSREEKEKEKKPASSSASTESDGPDETSKLPKPRFISKGNLRTVKWQDTESQNKDGAEPRNDPFKSTFSPTTDFLARLRKDIHSTQESPKKLKGTAPEPKLEDIASDSKPQEEPSTSEPEKPSFQTPLRLRVEDKAPKLFGRGGQSNVIRSDTTKTPAASNPAVAVAAKTTPGSAPTPTISSIFSAPGARFTSPGIRPAGVGLTYAEFAQRTGPPSLMGGSRISGIGSTGLGSATGSTSQESVSTSIGSGTRKMSLGSTPSTTGSSISAGRRRSDDPKPKNLWR